jgi:hypothetical protein
MRISKDSGTPLPERPKDGIDYFKEASKMAKPYPTSSGRGIPFPM